MEVKETLRTLLDHGSEFINTNCEIPFHSFLVELLSSGRWSLESIRLLISRGADPGQYVPPLGACLPLAISGSQMESPEGLRDALTLLIMNGADVYARNSRGRSATDIVSDARPKWRYKNQMHKNSNLKLKDIWTEALAACGYDPEEVIHRSLQVAELSDSDTDMDGDEDDHDSEDEDEDGDEYDISEAEDEDNVVPHQNDEDITQGKGPESSLDNTKDSFITETCSYRGDAADDESREQTGPAVQGNFDWSTLEDDMNVWRT